MKVNRVIMLLQKLVEINPDFGERDIMSIVEDPNHPPDGMIIHSKIDTIETISQ
jgi:hypothetical protein